MDYVFNEHNVVLNPSIIFEYEPVNALVWMKFQLKVGRCVNGLWDFGYWIPGGCSPVCFGRYETKQECKEIAIDFLKDYFKSYVDKGYNYKKYFIEAKTEFNRFLNRELLKQESQTSHLIHIADNGTNYTQGYLF